MAGIPPLPLVYEGDRVFRAAPRFAGLCEENFGAGEVVVVEVLEDRSMPSHRHEFAWLKEAWANLPEDLQAVYPSPEVLRKRALIATGWCEVKDYVCISKVAARRQAAVLDEHTDIYTVITVSERVVRVMRAKSQAVNRMKKTDFEASKQDILSWVANLLQVEPEALRRAEAA